MTGSCLAGWVAWSINEINRRLLVEQNGYFRQGWTQAQDKIIELKGELERAYICLGKFERLKGEKGEEDHTGLPCEGSTYGDKIFRNRGDV